MDALITALTTSVLGTFRVFMILIAGIVASKWPRKERECLVGARAAFSSHANRIQRVPWGTSAAAKQPQTTSTVV